MMHSKWYWYDGCKVLTWGRLYLTSSLPHISVYLDTYTARTRYLRRSSSIISDSQFHPLVLLGQLCCRPASFYPFIEMKANYLITAISLLLANVNGQGVIDVLNLNGFTNFATGLQNYPDLLSEISCRNRIIVWAPINEVPDFSSHVNDTTPLLFRRQSLDVLKYGQHASEPTSSSPQPTTTSNQKRHIGTLPDSNAEVLRTFLRDPRFVNLGPHERGRIVQNYAAPSHGSRGEANLEIKAGLGIAEKVSGPFKYDHGIIYGVNKSVCIWL